MSEIPRWQKVAYGVAAVLTLMALTGCGGSEAQSGTTAPAQPAAETATWQVTDFCTWLAAVTRGNDTELERLALSFQCHQYLGAAEEVNQGIPALPTAAPEGQVLLMNQEALDEYFSDRVIKIIGLVIDGYKVYQTVFGEAAWGAREVENQGGETQRGTILTFYDSAAGERGEISLEFIMPEVNPRGEFVIGNSCRTLIAEKDGSLVVDIFVPDQVKMEPWEVDAVVEASLAVAREIEPEDEITVRLNPFLQTAVSWNGEPHREYTPVTLEELDNTITKTKELFLSYNDEETRVAVEVFPAHSDTTDGNRFELDQVLKGKGAVSDPSSPFVWLNGKTYNAYDPTAASQAVRVYTLPAPQEVIEQTD